MADKTDKLTKAQKEFITVLRNSSCNISVACGKMNISRQTFYVWKKNNPTFAESVSELEESLIDYAETKLMENIRDGKESSIFFFLKTRGKKRGYIETVENNVNVNPFEELMKSLPDTDE